MAGIPRRMNIADKAHQKWVFRRMGQQAGTGSKNEEKVESTTILSSEKTLMVEGKMDLEEYSDEALATELARRKAVREKGLCSYCLRRLSEKKNCRLHEKEVVGSPLCTVVRCE